MREPIALALRLELRGHGAVYRHPPFFEIGHLERLIERIVEIVDLLVADGAVHILLPRRRLREPAVGHEGHRLHGLFIALGAAARTRGVERTRTRAGDVVVERTPEPPDCAALAEREVEVGERDERDLAALVEGDVECLVVEGAEGLHPAIPFGGRARRVAVIGVFEEMRDAHAPVRRRGARHVGEQPVHVEVVRDIEREIGVAPDIEVERLPLRGRGDALEIARLVDERRRNVREPFQGQHRRGEREVDGRGVVEEHAPPPDVALVSAEIRMHVVRDRAVEVVDRLRERGLRELARRGAATEIGRRQARAADERRERHRRNEQEGEDAENNQQGRTVAFHRLSSGASR